MSAPTPPSRAVLRAALAAAAVLVIAGLASFWFASSKARRVATQTAGEVVGVTITAQTCEPNDLVVPAGRTTFRIINASDRAVEWEILDGVMVVEERENIAPGFTQELTVKLAPGDYAITCGLLSNPRGTLRVTPTAASAAEVQAGPPLAAFIGPLAEYRVYLAQQSAALVQATRLFTEAVKAGDLQRARALYGPARIAYKRIEPVAGRFADLDTAIDAPATYYQQREQDPAFTGFHRIEHGLFATGSTDGLAGTADKLLADVTALRQRISEFRLSPDAMASGAERVIAQVAAEKGAAGEALYSRTDLADFRANLDGVGKIIDLLRPLVIPANPDLANSIDARFAEAEAALQRFAGPDGFVPYDRLSADDRAELGRRMGALAGELGRLNPALGLS